MQKGMSPEKLALTLALGMCFGIMPFMGVTTYILALIAIILRLNIPAIQLVNYAMYFFQITLYVPFLKSGQHVFGGSELPFELNNVISMLKTQFWSTLEALWQVNLLGILMWLIISVPVGIGIYYLSLSFFTKQQKKLIPQLA